MTTLSLSASRQQVLCAEALIHPAVCAIKARVASKLAESNYHQLQRVESRVCGNRIVLDGIVSSFYLKQLAQAALREFTVDGRVIENNLQVNWKRG